MYRLFTICAVGIGLTVACQAETVSLYFQGFESNANDWVPDTGGSPAGTITQVANGGGTLHLTAPDGSHYAEVTNSPDAYQTGYGTGGYSLYGTTPIIPIGPQASVTQSMEVYINTALNSGSEPGFWIDDSPYSSSLDPNNQYGGEHNFRLAYNGTSVGVSVDGETSPLYTITSSGWYNFQFTYSQSDSNPTDDSITTVAIGTPGGTQLAMETEINNVLGEHLENQDLEGPNYTWLPVWENGFSGDTLAIDDVQVTETTPEPSTWALSLIAFSGLAIAARKRVTAKS